MAGFRTNTHKQQLPYTLAITVRKKISFTTETEIIQYLEINLIRKQGTLRGTQFLIESHYRKSEQRRRYTIFWSKRR